jgi:hypothetical protein
MTERQEQRRSVTLTALVVFGMAITAAGLVMVLFGLGGSTVFEVTLGDWTVKTTSTGLAVMVIGSALSTGVVMNLPQGAVLFGPTRRTWSERLRSLALPLAILTVICLVLLAVSLAVG